MRCIERKFLHQPYTDAEKKNGLLHNRSNPLFHMAQRTGLEPATPGVTGRYSNRLNYRCMIVVVGAEGIEPPTLSL